MQDQADPGGLTRGRRGVPFSTPSTFRSVPAIWRLPLVHIRHSALESDMNVTHQLSWRRQVSLVERAFRRLRVCTLGGCSLTVYVVTVFFFSFSAIRARGAHTCGLHLSTY